MSEGSKLRTRRSIRCTSCGSVSGSTEKKKSTSALPDDCAQGTRQGQTICMATVKKFTFS